MKPGDRPADPQELEGVDAMGRGRQKAKQMKVARRLKYFSPDTDLDALQRELAGSSEDGSDYKDPYADSEESDDYEDKYWEPDGWQAGSSR